MSGFKRNAEELISNFRTLKAGEPRNNTHGLANFFCKQPASKYFRLCRPHTVSVATNQLCHCGVKTATGSAAVNMAVFQ